MDLSIIIINWNSTDFLKKCLESIYKYTRDLKFEIIVVDNASYDGCNTMLDNNFKDVVFIQSDKNLGFAAANNLGFKSAKSDYILFLNPDTELTGNSLKTLCLALQKEKYGGVISCKLLNTDLSVQTSCVQSYPTIINQIFNAEALRNIFPHLKIWGTSALYSSDINPIEVEVLPGACLLVKRIVFEQVGLFSDDYFMYAEDVDLCYKIKNNGYKVFFINSETVIHHGGGSSEKQKSNTLSTLIYQESLSRFLKKTRGNSYEKLYRFFLFFAACVRVGILFVVVFFKIILLKSRITPLQKWIAILLWSIGLKKPKYS